MANAPNGNAGGPADKPHDAFDLSFFDFELKNQETPPQTLEAQAIAPRTPVLDLRAVDDGAPPAPLDLRRDTDHPAHEDAVNLEPRPRPAGAGWGAMALALGWTTGAGALALAQFGGMRGLWAEGPMTIAMTAAAAILPSVLILACSAAAREAYKARVDQHRLNRVARKAMMVGDETAGRAQAFGHSIRAEIAQIQDAMSLAIDRMAVLEAAAIRNAHAFDDVIKGAGESAAILTNTLNHERAAFVQLNAELQAHTEQMGSTVGRQIRLMREASLLVRQETARADQSLTANIASLATSTAAISEKTDALGEAVNAAAHVSQRFDHSMGSALHALGEATKLNDSARQSAETSATTAQNAAQAVRDASVRAAADARRVTEMIRAETKAMADQAQATLDLLKAAAEEARAAALTSEVAAERYTTPAARQANAPKHAPQRTAPAPAPAPAPHSAPRRTFGRAQAAMAAPMPANDYDPREDLRRRAIQLVIDAGAAPEAIFTTADLDYIAMHSREGASARRRAVSLAASDTVSYLAQRLHADGYARDTATAYRAQPELATGDAGRGALTTYLLLDAALG